jgi:prevent-host-death family protein
MPSLDRIKPISYFKANAAEMLKELRETGQPYVLTQNGEAAAVLVDAHEYDKLQRALALAQIIRISEEQYRRGEGRSISSVKKRINDRRTARKS